MTDFFKYLFVMALVTYLVRMLPLVLVKKKITNRFLLSFLHYIPCAVLTVMTVPAMFFSTSSDPSITSVLPATVGFAVALFFAYREKTLVVVAAFSCISVFVTDLLLKLL